MASVPYVYIMWEIKGHLDTIVCIFNLCSAQLLKSPQKWKNLEMPE